MRRALAIVAVLAVGVTASACQREEDKKLELGRIIDRTERVARNFVYVDVAAQRTQVVGVVEDDFRYKARLMVDGKGIKDEVISDDAYAARFLDPQVVPNYLNQDAAIAAAQSGSNQALPALVARRWVLDEAGAPQLTRTATDRRLQGEDPVYDALTALQFVRQAVNRAVFVDDYSPDSIEPVYKESEDPFPKPPRDSKTTRYDLAPPKLPKAAATGSQGNQAIPEEAHFRKMVVYVRDGRIIEVREIIDVASKLDDLRSLFNLPDDTSVEQVVAAINAVRKGQGTDPIRVRRLTLQLSRFGEALKIELPPDAIKAQLDVLRYRGQQRAPGARQPTA